MPAGVYVNDYSFHGQFHSSAEVIDALKRLRFLHAKCGEFRTPCFCSRVFLGTRPAMPPATVRDVVMHYGNPGIKSVILSWLDKSGPFWDTERIHDSDDWYFCRTSTGVEHIVTDSALAECVAHELNERSSACLISATPSNCLTNPIYGGIRYDDENEMECELPNHWTTASLTGYLADQLQACDWESLAALANARFKNLTFGGDAFTPLSATPFSVGLRDALFERFAVLDEVSAGIDAQGQMNTATRQLWQMHSVGEKAWFTDSSDREKVQFESDLTFCCPITDTATLFPWHGKVKMGYQYRIHFGWPKSDQSRGLPVVYVGPKITKR